MLSEKCILQMHFIKIESENWLSKNLFHGDRMKNKKLNPKSVEGVKKTQRAKINKI